VAANQSTLTAWRQLVGLISLIVRYWRESRASLAWRWWQGLLLIGILVVGIQLLAPWAIRILRGGYLIHQ